MKYSKILRAELFKNISSNSLFIIIAILINVIAICIAFWDIVDNNEILIYWISIISVILLFSFYISNLFNNNPKKYKIGTYELLYELTIYTSSIVFSIGIVNIFPDNLPVYQTFLEMTITAIAAISVMSLSANRNLVVNNLIILVLPLINIYSFEPNYVTSLTVILYSIFLILLIIFSKKYNQNIIDLILSKLNIRDAQEEIIEAKEYFITLFEQAPIGIFTYDKNLNILQCNNEFATLIKYPKSQLIKSNIKNIMNENINKIFNTVFDKNTNNYKGEYFHKVLNENIWINIDVSPIHDNNDGVRCGLAIITDITENVKAEQKIHKQAFYDELTGLANRSTFNDRLEHYLPLLKRHNRFGAILFIDIDNFKEINDSLGHHIGDDVLKLFAKRINYIIREEDTFARLGGDEFVIILSDLDKSEINAINIANKFSKKLHTIISEPLTIYEHSLSISMSIGISLIGIQNQSKDDILRYADIAMYEAKRHGKNNTKIFEVEMSQRVLQELNLNNELKDAIKNNEFELFYQPIIDIENNLIVSCEALIRWNHPNKGLIYPIDFIPFAEKNDLLFKIGEYVIEEVCIQYNKWNKLKDMTLNDIAINISAKQFNEKNFESTLIKYINKYDVDPSAIKLELTESVIIENFNDTVKKINYLKEIGFKFSMDDFGTGYSSLSYLKNLPFDYLKIDQTFIRNILKDENDSVLVKTILTICEQFGFKVIAEGVETKEHVKFLKELKCDYYQGYHVSKPVNANYFKLLINEYNT